MCEYNDIEPSDSIPRIPHSWKEGKMQSSERSRSVAEPAGRHDSQYPDWIRAGFLSGFIATFAMTCTLAIGYGIANMAGDSGGNTLERWMFNLSENEITRSVGDRFLVVMIANLVFGLLWAMIYVRFAEPVMNGAGWRKGVAFSLIPWILSIVVFLPVAGAGFLGMDLDAGPLPVIGNLIIHLVYGLVLGALYAIDVESGLEGTRSDRYAAVTAERGAAIGLAIGGIVGAVGGWLVAGELDRLASTPVIALAGALTGAAIGTMLGSLIGMSEEVRPVNPTNHNHNNESSVPIIGRKV
jgi:hypothetical protein